MRGEYEMVLVAIE